MANHKSAEKRIRQTKTRTLHNKYYAKTMRNAVRKLRAMTDKEEATKLYPAVQKMLDTSTRIRQQTSSQALLSTSTSWDKAKLLNIHRGLFYHRRIALCILLYIFTFFII